LQQLADLALPRTGRERVEDRRAPCRTPGLPRGLAISPGRCINGDYGSGDLLGANAPAFLDKNAFVSPASFAYGTTPRTLVYGLRNPPRYNQDLSLRRDFGIREGLTFRVQADAINVFNLVNFSSPNTTITSANFGKITGQANLPRVVQFTARVSF
jgi:hypothetical protein